MADQIEPTLQSLVNSSLKWIFVGGKGGVGKTTTSCSVAIQLAKKRKSVLIISTDPAHNLSDAFQQKITSSPSPINGTDNLFAMEVDPKPQKLEMEGLSETDGGFLQDLMGSIPGIDEAMSFAEVMKLVQSLEYDTVVFDTAPTGHTLRLLQFPDTLQKALGKLQQLQGSLGPMVSAMGPLLGGGADASGLFGQISELEKTVTEVKNQFQDATLTTFVCVCIPEFLSLYETERLVQELTKQDIDVHNIVVNQVIFKGPNDFSALLDARIRMQNKYLEQYDELYGEDMCLVKMPLLEAEVRGLKQLDGFSKYLLQPYVPPEISNVDPWARIKDLESEVAELQQKLSAAKA